MKTVNEQFTGATPKHFAHQSKNGCLQRQKEWNYREAETTFHAKRDRQTCPMRARAESSLFFFSF